MATEHREFAIDDPEELSQKTRIRNILERRKDVLEARNMSKDEELLGSATYQDALGHYQNHLETLIIDLWTKFKETDTGTEYLERKHIADVEVPPPPELLPDEESDYAAGADVPDTKEVSIHGLSWFVDSEPVVTAEFTTTTWNPPGERKETNGRLIPRHVIDKALTITLEFMNDAGVDADLGGEESDAGFSYPDFVDEEMLEDE